MAKKFKKLDDDTLEITYDNRETVSKKELEQKKAGLEAEIKIYQDKLAEVNEQLSVF
jgi:hypothetical protein